MFFDKKNKYFKKIGFYKDQNGIIKRYLREKENWNLHLQKTKNFILESAKTKQKSKAVVFGSGWLLDVPIDELAKMFEQVILIDIFHPKEILNKISEFKNIKTLELDITGYSKPICLLKNHFDILSLEPDFEAFKIIENLKADFYISVNILNQLDILLVDYISTNWAISQADILDFRIKIQKEHLNLLPLQKTCLITDYEEENYINNKIVKTKKLVHIDLPNSEFTDTWQWIFDTHKMYDDFDKTLFNVKAIDF